MGLEGFRVASSIDIGAFKCQKLSSELHQLAVLLYPPELMNEKFLIRMRDCVLNLSAEHPVKKWLVSVAQSRRPSKEEQQKVDVINEIINSPFNLITDVKLKNKVIELLPDIPHNTLSEKILRAYLYLMIGNITRSDNVLKSVLLSPPRANWKGFHSQDSLYHRLAKDGLDRLLEKLAKHPADRRTFELFCLYLLNFTNDKNLLKLVSDNISDDLKGKLGLVYINKAAPAFVHYLRLNIMSEERRLKQMRRTDYYPLSEQSQWEWPFMNIDPLISDAWAAELKRLKTDDPLWLIYLFEDEKLADFYTTKVAKYSLQERRHFLREALKNKEDFMLALFKLIEYGDIDQGLVNQVSSFLTHE